LAVYFTSKIISLISIKFCITAFGLQYKLSSNAHSDSRRSSSSFGQDWTQAEVQKCVRNTHSASVIQFECVLIKSSCKDTVRCSASAIFKLLILKLMFTGTTPGGQRVPHSLCSELASPGFRFLEHKARTSAITDTTLSLILPVISCAPVIITRYTSFWVMPLTYSGARSGQESDLPLEANQNVTSSL
jgi:hypothetical protein